jgi:hypothetical protein
VCCASCRNGLLALQGRSESSRNPFGFSRTAFAFNGIRSLDIGGPDEPFSANGATAFLPFWTYVVEFEYSRSSPRIGPARLRARSDQRWRNAERYAAGFKTIAETAEEKSLVVWINEYFGPVARVGKTFDQMQVYLDNPDNVLTSIGIPQRAPDTFAENIRRMRERKLTFEESIRTAPGFYIMDKSRL